MIGWTDYQSVVFNNLTSNFTYLPQLSQASDKVARGGDYLHYRLNFDLDKARQKFHHSLKERHKISNIPKFRCEML